MILQYTLAKYYNSLVCNYFFFGPTSISLLGASSYLTLVMALVKNGVGVHSEQNGHPLPRHLSQVRLLQGLQAKEG